MVCAGERIVHRCTVEDEGSDVTRRRRWGNAASQYRRPLDGPFVTETRAWVTFVSLLLLQDDGDPWTAKRWLCFTKTSWTKTEYDTRVTTSEWVCLRKRLLCFCSSRMRNHKHLHLHLWVTFYLFPLRVWFQLHLWVVQPVWSGYCLWLNWLVWSIMQRPGTSGQTCPAGVSGRRSWRLRPNKEHIHRASSAKLLQSLSVPLCVCLPCSEWYRRNFSITLLMARVALNAAWKSVTNRSGSKKSSTPDTWWQIKPHICVWLCVCFVFVGFFFRSARLLEMCCGLRNSGAAGLERSVGSSRSSLGPWNVFAVRSGGDRGNNKGMWFIPGLSKSNQTARSLLQQDLI